MQCMIQLLFFYVMHDAAPGVIHDAAPGVMHDAAPVLLDEMHDAAHVS